ncbi:transferrin receptor-like dimerization domain protein [Teladorsagia circumcincta]|uniref:Transferrin receptor-like dimerization domain protein n=1 Tax=Teladorsagia circumcincta TaxID=45464 RepID=A0A2G9TZ39_TELCI|nr:transferrin receptor-like dimerization domain protein [Teladorsagia circumcincta]
MFAAWDAEEYGLLGSTEFVEDFTELLTRRAVAYLNMDCLQGNQTIRRVMMLLRFVESMPSLQDQAIQAAKRIKNPRQDDKDVNGTTVFDAWLHYMKDSRNPGLPRIPTPSGGSDQKSFMEYLGVPSMSFSWMDMDKHQTYPLYHTLYETPFLSEHLMDVNNFAQFEVATRKEEAIHRPRSMNPLVRSRYNDKLINVERCFVNPRGTPDDAAARHVLFSISKTDSYAGRVMQQVYKVLDDMAVAKESQLPDLGNELANQISIVHSSILCALGVLSDFI